VLGQCHRNGISALVWTVDEDKQLRGWLANSRVTILVTNRPAQAVALRAELDNHGGRASHLDWHFAPVGSPAGVSLCGIHAHPGSSIGDIPARAGMPQSHVSETVARLREQ
jgi:hypothetical protein